MGNNADELRGENPEMGARMRLIRESAGLTQTAFAILIGTTAQSVSGYENGNGVPWQVAVRIVEAMPWLTTDYIYRGTLGSPEMARKWQRQVI